jgi:hypothetical protein
MDFMRQENKNDGRSLIGDAKRKIIQIAVSSPMDEDSTDSRFVMTELFGSQSLKLALVPIESPSP